MVEENFEICSHDMPKNNLNFDLLINFFTMGEENCKICSHEMPKE